MANIIVRTLLLSMLISLLAGNNVFGQNVSTRIAILDFCDGRNLLTPETQKLSLMIFSELSTNPNIDLIERNEIKSLLTEQKFVSRGMSDSKKNMRIGEILGANYLISGKIYTIDASIILNAKLISCNNGKCEGVTSVHKENESIEDILVKFSSKVKEFVAKKFPSIPTKNHSHK